MPHVLRKACVSPDVNSVPASDNRVSGTPLSVNRDLRHAMRALTQAPDIPAAARVMSIHPESLSTEGRHWASDCSVGTWAWDGAFRLHIPQPILFFSMSRE